MKSEQWGDQHTERYWPGLHTSTSWAPSQEGSRGSISNSGLTGAGHPGPAPGDRAAWVVGVQPLPESVATGN